MNWTSTKVPLWQLDCQNYWRAGTAFEVRDVTKDQDVNFIETFATSHGLSYTRKGSTVYFERAHFGPDQPPKL
jgi:hypothetical protein